MGSGNRIRLRWFKALLALAGGVVAAFLVRGFMHAAEPSYQGKPLSYWMEHLSGYEFVEAFGAIRAAGPVGVPRMLQNVRRNHAIHRRLCYAIWPKLPVKLQKYLASPQSPDELDQKIIHALSVLDASGLPPILAAMHDSNWVIRFVAAESIGRMSLNDQVVTLSAPELSNLLADSDLSVRNAATAILSRMGPRAKSGLPVLIKLLAQKTSDHRSLRIESKCRAAQVLGLIGKDARAAVPDLKDLMRQPERSARSEAAVALWRIQHDRSMVVALTAELENAPVTESDDLLLTLGEIGPAAKSAVPVMLKKLQEPGVRSISTRLIHDCLRKIDPERW